MNLGYVLSWSLIQEVTDELYFTAEAKTRWADPLEFPAKRLMDAGLKRTEVKDFRKKMLAEAALSLEAMIDVLNDSGKTNMWEEIQCH